MPQMMTATIRAFQAIDRADIDFGAGVTLVTGQNSQGKSSIAKAFAGALAGDPLHGELKKNSRIFVRDGSKAGTIQIAGPEGSITVTYPKVETSSTGTPPTLSRIAAGLDSLVDMDAKKRATLLGGLLKTDPSREDIAAALAELKIKDAPEPEVVAQALDAAGKAPDPGLSLTDHVKFVRSAGAEPNIVEWLWWQVGLRGWDGAHKKLSEDRTRMKGQWESVAGEAYGPGKIQTWTPKGWTTDLGEASPAGLEAIATSARQALETAIAAQAVDQSELDRLRSSAGKMDELKQAEATAREAKMDAEVAEVNTAAALKSAQKTVDNLLPAEPDTGLACPHCQKLVHYHRGADGERLDKAERISDDELRKRRGDRASAEAKLSAAKPTHSTAAVKLRDAQRALDDAQRAVAEAEAAKRRLTELEAESAGKTGSSDAVQQAREALDRAEQRLALRQTKARADALARQITVLSSIIDLLAPEGLRMQKLVKVLGVFNDDMLRPLCALAGWQTVRVEPDMSITYGGRPYHALSGLGPQLSSDQFRVRVILQVALAQRAEDACVIIDAADVLDQKGRNGIMALLNKSEMAALVCMTFSHTLLVQGKVPDLEKARLGRTYWLSDGVALPLHEAVAAAQPAKAA